MSPCNIRRDPIIVKPNTVAPTLKLLLDVRMKFLSKLGRFVACLIILELVMILGEFIVLLNGGTEHVAVAKSLLSGQLGYLFIGVEIILGAIIPIVLLLKKQASVFSQALATLLILVGIFVMRYVIVIGGQLIS